MGKEFILLTDPWKTNLRAFNAKLENECILFKTVCVDGDETTCFHDCVEYSFRYAKDLALATEIIDEM